MDKLTFIFGLSSLLGLLLAIAFSIIPVVSADMPPAVIAVIIALASINIAIGLVSYAIFRRALLLLQDNSQLLPKLQLQEREINDYKLQVGKAIDDQERIALLLHNIQDQLRDRLYELIEISASPAAQESETLIDVRVTNEMFYLFVANNVKTIMEILTKDKCSVSIKVAEERESETVIRTFIRDTESYPQRKEVDAKSKSFPYYTNSAFRDILRGHVNYFVSNDLGSDRTYANMNSSWSKHYNATLVYPIRLQEVPEIEIPGRVDYDIPGFLCVDNFAGNLNSKACVSTLASVADSLYVHFHLLSLIGLRNALPRLPQIQ